MPKNGMPKSRISGKDVEDFIAVLREKLGPDLPNLVRVDDAIREAVEECFFEEAVKIDINRIKSF